MTKVLLTGFEPFGKASQNPSAEIVKAIIGDNLVTAILPVKEILLAINEAGIPATVSLSAGCCG